VVPESHPRDINETQLTEGQNRGQVRACTRPNVSEGVLRPSSTDHGYMHDCAFRLDNSARSATAHITFARIYITWYTTDTITRYLETSLQS
jgi:hypothetical protein